MPSGFAYGILRRTYLCGREDARFRVSIPLTFYFSAADILPAGILQDRLIFQELLQLPVQKPVTVREVLPRVWKRLCSAF